MQSYAGFSDQELTILLKDGNALAFTEIYNRYKGLLYIHAYKRLYNREAVNDVIQELFTALWNKRETITFTGQLSGYLYTSVRNRVIDILSKQRSESAYIQSLQNFIDQGEDVADHLIREKQLIEVIEKEISLLPPKMREVFELSRKAHLSHREIAERLNLSELTVKKHVNNALKILRTKLGLLIFLYFISNL